MSTQTADSAHTETEQRPSPAAPPLYIGSVRFFKHMILTVLALAILAPTALSVIFGIQNISLRGRVNELSQALAEAEASTPEPAPTPTPSPIPTPEPTPLPAEHPSWQDLYPELYAIPAARSTVYEDKTVYLTFDDGPSVMTPAILEILACYDVKATFFVTGHENEQSRQWMRDILDAGHSLGVHSYSHNYKYIYSSTEAFLEDFSRIYDLVNEATGVPPQLCRFPGGSINGYNGDIYSSLISEVVRRGFVYFDWNVSVDDTIGPLPVPVDRLVKNAMSRVNEVNRAVILMHDSADKGTTVDALPAIIEGYRDAGFSFAALTPEVEPVIYKYPN